MRLNSILNLDCRSEMRYASLLFLLQCCSFNMADPFSLGIGGAVVVGGGVFYGLRNFIKCNLYECCNAPYIRPDFDGMVKDLSLLLYGQHIVEETVIPALMTHFRNKQPSKPLVMSFHGGTGSGKNYAARIIAKHLYKKGMDSRFVHHYVSIAEFSDASKIHQYKVQLHERVRSGLAQCGQTLFIFDEVDKMPNELLSVIKPFLDYYENVDGVDSRHAIFIFLSNAGGNVISEMTKQHLLNNQPRTKLKLVAFERIVSDHVYNKEGGMNKCDLITNHLIDHFIPFLPLEKEHVRMCIKFYLNEYDSIASKDDALVEDVLRQLHFFPEDKPLLSSSGCKRVSTKADLALFTWRQKRRAKSGEPKRTTTMHDEI